MIYNKSSRSKKLLFTALGIVLLAALILTALEMTNTTHLFHKQPSAITASQDTKGEVAQPNNSSANNAASSNSDQTTQPGDNKSNSNTPISETLKDPTGEFVSNHHPNLSGSPAPNSMSSVCTTTPGATCQITFIKDGVTKSLEAQMTDRGGSVYWNWKIQDIGLSAGSWQVQAVASQSGKIKTTTDPLALEIAQ